MTASKTLFYLCVSFVAGIFLESLVYNWAPEFVKSQTTYVVFGFFVVGILIIFTGLFFKKNIVMIVGFCMLVLVLGIMRFGISEFMIKNSLLEKLNDGPDKVTLTGQIADGPVIKDRTQQLKVAIKHATGFVLVTTSNYVPYHYLDTITLSGKLQTPKTFDDFNYKNYLLKDSIYSTMYYPKITIVSVGHTGTPFTFLYNKILFLKEKMRQAIYGNFSGPQRLILEGILLGDNKNMTQDLRDKLNVTGLRYLTAISGVHIIILSEILMVLCLALGLWRGQAFYVSLIFIWLYIMLTGFSASGIRAAIMGSIFLWAQKLGRQNTSARTITLAATFMLLQNPLLLFYDIGFQFSFLASLGIIHFKPIVENMIQIFTKDYFRHIVEMTAVTLTAQVFILPIMAYNFGSISLIAPITSLLVIPVMPWIMGLGFVASFGAIILPAAGWLFSLPCWFVVTYFADILTLFSQPWALATIQHISWIWVGMYYALLFALIFYLQKFQKPKFLGY